MVFNYWLTDLLIYWFTLLCLSVPCRQCNKTKEGIITYALLSTRSWEFSLISLIKYNRFAKLRIKQIRTSHLLWFFDEVRKKIKRGEVSHPSNYQITIFNSWRKNFTLVITKIVQIFNSHCMCYVKKHKREHSFLCSPMLN